MVLSNTWRIPVVDCWEPFVHGVFWDKQDEIKFLYLDNLRSISEFSPFGEKAKKMCSVPRESNIELPRRWCILNDYLFLSEYTGIDLSRMQFRSFHTDEQRKQYRNTQKPEKYFEEGIYHLGEYTIKHKGEWGYTCNVADNQIWTFSGKGYLHTEFSRYQDTLYFATAGHGGYFYMLDILTGKTILSINTGGTAAIVEKSGLCYFLGKNPLSQLFCVDINKGCILESLSLPGTPSRHSVLHMWNDRFFATTFQYKNKKPTNVLLSEIQIG